MRLIIWKEFLFPVYSVLVPSHQEMLYQSIQVGTTNKLNTMLSEVVLFLISKSTKNPCVKQPSMIPVPQRHQIGDINRLTYISKELILVFVCKNQFCIINCYCKKCHKCNTGLAVAVVAACKCQFWTNYDRTYFWLRPSVNPFHKCRIQLQRKKVG